MIILRQPLSKRLELEAFHRTGPMPEVLLLW
jgi:hypothetical protein